MPLPPPDMAKIDTQLIKHVRRFHEKFVYRLTSGSKEMLRSAAWQLDAFIQENKQYKDADYLRTMLKTVEWVIQKKWNTNWTVERAKRDLRGRTTGVNQFTADKPVKRRRVPISKNLQRSLEDRLIPSKESPAR